MDYSTRQTLPQRDQSCLETVTRQKRRPAKMEPWSRNSARFAAQLIVSLCGASLVLLAAAASQSWFFSHVVVPWGGRRKDSSARPHGRRASATRPRGCVAGPQATGVWGPADRRGCPRSLRGRCPRVAAVGRRRAPRSLSSRSKAG